MAAYHGLRWVGVELEEKFVRLGRENISLHTLRLQNLGAPLPVLIQGDSRRFAEIIRDHIVGVVSSPPFGGQQTGGGIAAALSGQSDYPIAEGNGCSRTVHGTGHGYQDQGSAPGQIASLVEGNLDGVLSSPPYNLPMSQEHNGRRGGERGTQQAEPGEFARYGDSDGQIEGLSDGSLAAVLTSPPYADSIRGDNSEQETREHSLAKRNDPAAGGCLGASQRHAGYGCDPANIGNLSEGRIDGGVTSPPFADCLNDHDDKFTPAKASDNYQRSYGETPGQVGREAGETYWQAMAEVYRSMLAALRPGGVCAIVVKDYVKARRRVRLCDDTLRLLTALGATPICRARAHLVEETTTPTLFGPPAVVRKERKSFFRRLYESDLPADSECRIDWEEVIFVQKVRKTGGES